MIKLAHKQTMLQFECDMGRVVRRLGLVGGHTACSTVLVVTAGAHSSLQAYEIGETIATGHVTK